MRAVHKNRPWRAARGGPRERRGARGRRAMLGRCSAAAHRRPGRDTITLERPPKADFGDYSTNAALLLAPALGRAAARGRRAAGRGAQARARRAARALRGRGSGLPEPVPRRLLAADALAAARRRRDASARAARSARTDPRRVRLGQPDRADARRPRPQRRLRRFARARARLPRPRGRTRVLRQRRGLAGSQARRVDRGARAGRRGSRRTAITATTCSALVPTSSPDAGRRLDPAELGQAGGRA